MGGLLAATAAQLNSFAGIPQIKKSGDNNKQIDFIYDGTELSPKEYANLLMKLVDEGKVKVDNYSMGGIVEELEKLGSVSVEEKKAILCIVGEGLRSTPGIAARVFSTIRDINVSLISQGASRINLTFAVEEARAREAVMRLHREFFEKEFETTEAATSDIGHPAEVMR